MVASFRLAPCLHAVSLVLLPPATADTGAPASVPVARPVARRLTSGLAWSFVGTGLPMIAAVLAAPLLVHGMGTARFGVLSLAWVVIGYFSLFDLGLGRAMTQLVAERLGAGDEAAVPAVVWLSMELMAALGVGGGLLMAALAPWLSGTVLKIPAELRGETRTTLFILALSIPVVIGTTGLRGILEAYQRFDLANVVRVPLGVLMYGAPLLVLPFSHTLPAVVAALLVVRVATFLVYLVICVREYPHVRQRSRPGPETRRRLLAFSGWTTVSNVAAPLLLHAGRFMIAAIVSAGAVAYFSVPYDALTNLLAIPGAFVSVLFPMFTQLFAGDPAAVVALYRRSLRWLLLLMVPVAVVGIVMARPGLALWINTEFAVHGYRVAQILLLGVLINSVGHVAQSVVQASGRPDLTAKLHVAELVLFVPYCWWLVRTYGVNGAAVAWTVRVSISTAVLSYLAHRSMSRAGRAVPSAGAAGAA